MNECQAHGIAPCEDRSMSLFMKLDLSDPYDTFAVVMRRSRMAMERTFEAAFNAHKRCRELLHDHLWQSVNVSDPLGFALFGTPQGWNPEPNSREELDRMWLDAIAEDFQCDHLAAPSGKGAILI
jgi:hypothetical protein